MSTPGSALNVLVLGPVVVQAAQTTTPITRTLERALLARLALADATPVPDHRLITDLWGHAELPRLSERLRVLVSRLRTTLGDHAAVLTRTPGGYALAAHPADLIAAKAAAQRLHTAARTHDHATVRRAATDALRHWRGPALADLRTIPYAAIEGDRLDAWQLDLHIQRLTADLELGRTTEATTELHQLATQHPLHEQLTCLLARALYISGQSSQALEVCRRTRQHLSQELGIDPGSELQRLELAILRNDPALSPPKAQAAAGASSAVSLATTPAQLPPGVADFTGRAAHLRQLDALLSEPSDSPAAVVLSAIAGTAGVGKTALALHWAHGVRDRFPDGQLYVNLRGYDSGPPLRSEQALVQMLRAMGVPSEQVPADVAEATGLYRTLLADNRVLIVLDNAAGAEQVRPLLPGSPTCLVVITSRDRLDGLVALDAVRRITLDVLPVEEAVALLRRMLGEERVAAEPDAAAELARTCACLPLALRIAAAHLAGRPGRRLADHTADLRRGDPLAWLEVDGDDQAAVRVTFDHSYTALKPDAQRLFRLLALIPGPDIDNLSAAALADQPPAEATRLLDRLAAAHLIEEHAPGRYSFHDLLRRYAGERAYDHDSDSERIGAEYRLYDHYLRSANAAIDLLCPHMLRLPITPDLPTAGFDDHADALAWLDAERPNLVAAVHHAHQHGPGRIAWQLADVLRGYFSQRREFIDWFAVAHIALTAAQAADQPSARATAHFSLGTAHHMLNQYPQAIKHYTAALTSFAETGWLLGEAAALTNLGIIDESLGDLEQAARRHTQALALDRQAGSPDNEALALINLGIVNQYRGRLDQATDNYLQALAIAREVGARHAEGSALDYLGTADRLRGELDQALDHCTQALRLYHEVGARNDQAQALTHLANIHGDAGRQTAALDSANAALALSRDTGDGRIEAAARNAVAAVSHSRGSYQDAIDHYRHAQRLARDIGARYEECQALAGLAAGQLRLRQPDDALASAHHALALARNSGYRLLEHHALTIVADIQMHSGQTEAQAIHRAGQPPT